MEFPRHPLTYSNNFLFKLRQILFCAPKMMSKWKRRVLKEISLFDSETASSREKTNSFLRFRSFFNMYIEKLMSLLAQMT